jgi:hypothetical protein
LEYIRSCEELWSKGLYVELHAYQHHVFMDWRFVDDKRWGEIHFALNGAGVESMSAKWDEMFGGKEEVVEEEVKVKKPRKKVVKKKEERRKKVISGKKSAVKKPKSTARKLVKKKVVAKKKPVSKKLPAKASRSTSKTKKQKAVKK